MKLKFTVLISLFVLAMVAAGCGSGATYADVNTDTPDAAETSENDQAEEKDADEKKSAGKTVMPKVSGSLSSKPKISDASGEPPAELVEKNIKDGSGKAAKDGDEVTVNYVGHNWSNNEEFDSSWGKDPFKFKLGAGMVIQGWDQGVAGMKVGGRRLLVIPPDLGYGEQAQGAIPANETLIFVVDLKKIN